MNLGLSPKSKRHRRILCVDDYPPGLETRVLLLNAWGYSAMGAYTAEQALGVLERGSFDAVVADYAMPGMNGGDLARAVKSRWPAMRVVLISGLPRVPWGAMRHVDAFIVKGEGTGNLRSLLSRFLEPVSLPVRAARRVKALIGNINLWRAKA